MRSPSVYDHLRPVAADYPDGIYRVVGTDGQSATMLRVADAEGRRRNTGELITAPIDGFEPAENPDGNRTAGSRLVSRAATTYWQFRAVVHELVLAPVPTALGVGAILVGLPGILPISPGLRGGLVAAGSLFLALVGTGFYRRLR